MSSYFWSSTSSTDPTVGANWTKSDGTTGTAPGNGDDVTIAAIPGVALAAIAAADMSSITLNSLTIGQTFNATIGTTSTTGTFGYWKIWRDELDDRHSLRRRHCRRGIGKDQDRLRIGRVRGRGSRDRIIRRCGC